MQTTVVLCLAQSRGVRCVRVGRRSTGVTVPTSESFRALLRRLSRKISDILSRFYPVVPYMHLSMTYIASASMNRATLGDNLEERTYAVRPAPWDIKDIEADHDTNCHRPRNTRICPRPCARRRGVKRTWHEEYSGHRCGAHFNVILDVHPASSPRRVE